MNELPSQPAGLITGRLPPAAVQTMTALPSELQLRNQNLVVLGGLPGGQQHQLSATAALLESGVSMPVTTNIESPNVALSCQATLCDPNDPQKQAEPGQFTAASVAESTTTTTNAHENSSYKEVLSGLHSLWTDQKRDIEALTDDHWKNLEFPLARIKKIMRMDDDVKMISTEVPVMFSKILEIFITELTMRAWLHTEESKRRTVQRSDIAMAITKHDMFDFLIDIVPREEIQFRTKKDGGEGLQALPPDLLQNYIQQLINQTVMATTGEGGGEEGDEGDAATANTLQQLQLLQQLMQLQQAQQDQPDQQQQQQPPHQSVMLDQMPALTQPPSMNRHHHHQGHHSETTVLGGVRGGVDVRVLQSSMGAPPVAGSTGSSSMGSTLEQIAKNGGQCQLNSSDLQQESVLYQTQSLMHSIGHSENFNCAQQHQQQHEQQAATFSTDDHSHITTVVIPQPPDSLAQISQPRSLSSTVLESSSSFHSSHHPQMAPHQGLSQDDLRSHLESLATEQFITQQIPVELSTTFGGRPISGGGEGEGEDSGGIDVVEQRALQFQHISEGKSISGSLSAVDPGSQELANVIFTTDKQRMVEDVANT